MANPQRRANRTAMFNSLLAAGYDAGFAGSIANTPNWNAANNRFRNAMANAPGKQQQQPQQAQAPKEVKPITPPVEISKAGNVGVRQNKQTKRKGKVSIARSANVVPLQQGAVGYQGIRIS